MDREKIINATVSLFKSYGLKSMTIGEISARLGISKTIIYRHFKNREELLLECLSSMRSDINHIFDDVLANNNSIIGKISEIYNSNVIYLSEFDSTFYFDLQKNTILKSTVKSYIEHYKITRIHPLMRLAKQHRLLKPDIDIEDAADYFMKFIPHFFSQFKNDPIVVDTHLTSFYNQFFTIAPGNFLQD